MRADRLLSLMMILQAHGRMTAQALAEELYVSERTIYRDIEALSLAGVPIYAERGPGGGVALVENYRTSLTGLNRDEIQALLMLDIPDPLKMLGMGQTLKTALLKLAAAFHHKDESQRIYLDSTAWFEHDDSVPHLQTLHRAVQHDRKINLSYRLPFDTVVERIVAPYGLVAKTNVWYLVFAREDFIRVLRVSDIADAKICNESFERPSEFDLAVFWQNWCADVEYNRPQYKVKVRVTPELMPCLTNVTEMSGDTLVLTFESFEAARAQILNYGRAVEVLEPAALRKSVLDFARQIVDVYS